MLDLDSASLHLLCIQNHNEIIDFCGSSIGHGCRRIWQKSEKALKASFQAFHPSAMHGSEQTWKTRAFCHRSGFCSRLAEARFSCQGEHIKREGCGYDFTFSGKEKTILLLRQKRENDFTF